jgi:hypothetical protein
MNIDTLELLMRIALAKIFIESLDFDDIWKMDECKRYRRFRKWL